MQCYLCNTEIPAGKIKCPSCKHWNTTPGINSDNIIDQTVLLSEVKSIEEDRLDVGDLNKIWGGGIVPTSVTLIGGSPGAGKSTLLLQLLNIISGNLQRESSYIAAEESLPEIKLRAERLNLNNQHLIRMVPAMGGGLDLANTLVNRKPCAIVIDSLIGLVGKDDAAQEETCKVSKEYAVGLKAPVIIVQHVTKEEVIAGANTLQHTVDTTMTFFVDDETKLRQLEVLKNRFGEAFISQFFLMSAEGLNIYNIDEDEDDEDDEDDDIDEDDEYGEEIETAIQRKRKRK
jgi:DNA repair protein RadA/Sms